MGLKHWLKPESGSPTNKLSRFYLLQNHKMTSVEFEFFSGLLNFAVEDANKEKSNLAMSELSCSSPRL